MNKVLIVGGPTGSGKTKFAVNLAKELNGELINADSRQIYKYLNIGTNKGLLTGSDDKYLDGIPIHIIDILEPDKRFNVFDWRKAALNAIKDIQDRGKVSIVVGGTGLYIDSLIKEYNFKIEFNIPNSIKNELKSLDFNNLETVQNYFKDKLTEVWNSLNYSDQNNLRRLQRLVQKLIEENNEPKEDLKVISDYIFYYPNYSWEALKTKIENRVEEMFKEGLVEETKKVLEMGYSKDVPGLQVMGYKEVIMYLDGKITLDKCKELVKTSHKQYARRQRTWFEGEKRGYKFEYFNPISS